MYTYRIEQDEYGDCDPRQWDNLGIMVCFHRRYNLGDEQPKRVGWWLSEMLEEMGLARHTVAFEDFIYDLEDDAEEAIQKAFDLLSPHIVILPLYLYDHSGITIRTTSFSCPWDSGQVGFIYVTKARLRDEYGWERLAKQRRKRIETYLRNEVDEYDKYLTGDVWGYVIESEEDDCVESLWGFLGYETCEKEAREETERLNAREAAREVP